MESRITHNSIHVFSICPGCAGYLSHPPNLEGKIRVCGWGLDFVGDDTATHERIVPNGTAQIMGKSKINPL
jgi:hypothetical protein